jgi:hypothetical protein
VNDDGLADILVGGSLTNQVYLVYGSTAFGTGTLNLDLGSLDGTNGVVFRDSSRPFAYFGAMVDGAHDVNDDGVDDMIIGAPEEPPGFLARSSRAAAAPAQAQGLGNAFVIFGVPAVVDPTAVGLVGLGAAADKLGRVTVAWETASEVGVVGFHVERSRSAHGSFVRLNRSPIAATGSPITGASYLYQDAPGPGQAHYRLVVVNHDGRPEAFGPVSVLVSVLRLFLPGVWR